MRIHTLEDINQIGPLVDAVQRARAQWLDRPGNIVCLCPNCCAKFLHGSVDGEDPLGQVERYSGFGVDQPTINFVLCGEQVTLKFTEKHWVELEALLTLGTSWQDPTNTC